jgi:predicted HTH domain antitoxin
MGEITESIKEILEIIVITIVFTPIYIAMLIMVWICSKWYPSLACTIAMKIAYLINKITERIGRWLEKVGTRTAIFLYRHKYASLEKASVIAGMDLADFIGVLKKKGIIKED